MKKRFVLPLATSMLLLFHSCSVFDFQASEEIREIKFNFPEPVGEYSVGRKLIYLNAKDSREIAAWIYYPAENAENSPQEKILPPKWAESYRTILNRRLGKSAANALLNAETKARSDAQFVSGTEKFPLLIFAPGANWLPTDYSALIENLASSGYIIIAFASAPLSPVIQHADGTIAESPKVDEATYKIVSEDFLSVADQLGRIEQDETLRIKGRADLDKIGAFGHSIGGAAALSAAANSTKIKAAINLDGDFAGDSSNAAPQQTILYVTTEPPNMAGENFEKWDEDRSEIRRKNVWEKIAANSENAVRVRVAGMFHTNFSDAALLSPDAVAENLRKNRFGAIEGSRGIRLTSEIIRTFFDARLKSTPFENFLQIEQQFSEIKIESKTF